jgi:vancomycin resistance protein YoaR
MTDELTAPLAQETASLAPDLVATPAATTHRRGWTRFFVAFLAGLISALAIGAGALYAFDRQYSGRILPGVHVGAVDLSGLTPAEASSALNEAYASFGKGRAVVASGDLDMAIDYAEIGRRPDVKAMVAEALAIGRSGNAVDRAILNVRTAMRGIELQPRVTFEAARLARYVQTYAGRLTVVPKDASVTPTKKGFSLVEGVNGQTADRIPATDALTVALSRADAPADVRVELDTVPVEPDITTAEATDAKATAERLALDISLVEGKESWTISAATVRSWITFQPATDGGYEPVVATKSIEAAVKKVAKKVATAPKNATFRISGGKITGVVASRNGRAVDVAGTTARVAELLDQRMAGGKNASVEPALTLKRPALTTEEAKAAAPKMRRISQWTTYFPISERNHYGANIWIPALDIDGYVVAPGDTFDFWDAVGPVTRARGYGDGGAIINGKTEPQGALAGGICSCSTTLFNAALRAGFDMKARRNHFYYIDRYPVGLDATVFISASGSKQTMSFVNDTKYPVLIRGYKIKKGSSGYVKFEIYSVPSGRKVVISAPTIKNVRQPRDTVQYTSSLAPGVRQRVEYPVAGKDVWRTVTVFQGGKVLHRTTYYSHYATITGLTLVGR